MSWPHFTASFTPPPATFRGHYSATMLLLFVDAGIVASALPEGLTLYADATAPQGTHPVVVTMGSHSNVQGPSIPGSLNYLESVIGVPNLRVSGQRESVATYMSRLDVNSPLATVLGLSIGYTKNLNFITADAQNFFVSTYLFRAPILSAHFEPTTDWRTPADFQNFAYTAGLLSQPLVSVDITGQFLFSIFDWNFSQGKLRGAKTVVTVAHDLAAMPQGQRTASGYESTVAGSGMIDVSWTLTGPFVQWP